jgi:hypothetical protein
MNQGQGCEYYDQGTTKGFSLRVQLGAVTYGELPRTPVTSCSLSILRIRIATPRAAVVNVILMNRNNWQVVSGLPRNPPEEYASPVEHKYYLIDTLLLVFLLWATISS